MATHAIRSGDDLYSEIDTLIHHYPPLQADRKHLHIVSDGGILTISGHTRTAITRRYLLDRLKLVQGVRAVVADALYDDESIQREAGQVIAHFNATGAIINTLHGTVILTGHLPEGVTAAMLAEEMAAIPGVAQVVAKV